MEIVASLEVRQKGPYMKHCLGAEKTLLSDDDDDDDGGCLLQHCVPHRKIGHVERREL